MHMECWEQEMWQGDLYVQAPTVVDFLCVIIEERVPLSLSELLLGVFFLL